MGTKILPQCDIWGVARGKDTVMVEIAETL